MNFFKTTCVTPIVSHCKMIIAKCVSLTNLIRWTQYDSHGNAFSGERNFKISFILIYDIHII